jgi:dihydrofolate reductase
LQEPLEWNARLLDGNVADAVRRLKETDQNLLIYGSGRLVETLMQHNLIDVYRLMLYPVALASGQRLFREGGAKVTLALADVRSTGTGVVVLTYEASGA